jgi:hypothetical protein
MGNLGHLGIAIREYGVGFLRGTDFTGHGPFRKYLAYGEKASAKKKRYDTKLYIRLAGSG